MIGPQVFGANWFTWVQPWPPLLTVLAVGVGIAGILWGYRRQYRALTRHLMILIALRCAAFFVVLLMVYRFGYQPNATEQPDIVVCVDTSASMQVVDAYEGKEAARVNRLVSRIKQLPKSRLNLAKSILLSRLGSGERWHRRHHVKWKSLEGNIDSQDIRTAVMQLTANRDTSPLGEMVLAALNEQRGQPTSTILLVSDGITTSGLTLEAVAKIAASRGISIDTLALGSNQPSRDIELTTASSDHVAFVNEIVTMNCHLNSSGFSGEEVEVRFRRADPDGEGKELSSQRIALTDGTQTIRFTDQPTQAGRIEYVMDVDVRNDESNRSNNRATAFVDVRDETIKVLFVQSYPSYEYRYLKSLFGRLMKENNSSSTIELTVILQDGDPDLPRVDQSASNIFPPTVEQLLDYDVFLFGDVDSGRLGSTARTNIYEAISKHGRSAVFILGSRYSTELFTRNSMEALAPFDPSEGLGSDPAIDGVLKDELHTRLTAVGESYGSCQLSLDPTENKRIWKALAPVYWRVWPTKMKRGVRTLAELIDPDRGTASPSITLHYAGAGQVLCHFFEASWRWQFRDADQLFERYWLQSIRMLARSKLRSDAAGELTCTQQAIYEDDSVGFDAVLFRDPTGGSVTSRELATLVIESTGRILAELPLTPDLSSANHYRATSDPLPAGSYNAWVRADGVPARSVRCGFAVQAKTTEMSRLSTDFEALELLATRTGGQAYTVMNVDNLFREMRKPKVNQSQKVPPRSLWNTPWVVALLIGLLTAEWIVRRKFGLP